MTKGSPDVTKDQNKGPTLRTHDVFLNSTLLRAEHKTLFIPISSKNKKRSPWNTQKWDILKYTEVK